MKKVLAHASRGSTDTGISATLHIDPNDQPVTGRPAQFFFTFQDTAGTFEINQCDCVVTIKKNEEQFDQQPVTKNDTVVSSFGSQPLYVNTFEESGEYELTLNGSPKDGATFSPFALEYKFHVGGQGHVVSDHHASMAQEHLGHIIIFGGGLAVAITLLVRNYLKNRKQNN
jgi:hypothetical protein